MVILSLMVTLNGVPLTIWAVLTLRPPSSEPLLKNVSEGLPYSVVCKGSGRNPKMVVGLP